MTVLVKKIGGSVTVVIPKAVAREMNLAEGTELEITNSSTSIVLKKQHRRRRRPLSKIVAQIDPGSYRRHNRQFRLEKPVGKEIW